VRVVASAFRSQLRNRQDAEERLAALIRRALTVPKSRKKTRPSRSAVESRLRTKRKVSEKKRERRLQDLD
jgi:ribosome-associated protein